MNRIATISLRLLALLVLFSCTAIWADDCTYTMAKDDYCPVPPVTTHCGGSSAPCIDQSQQNKQLNKFVTIPTTARKNAIPDVEWLCYVDYGCVVDGNNNCGVDFNNFLNYYRNVYKTVDCDPANPN